MEDKPLHKKLVTRLAYYIRQDWHDESKKLLDEHKGSYAVVLFFEATYHNDLLTTRRRTGCKLPSMRGELNNDF